MQSRRARCVSREFDVRASPANSEGAPSLSHHLLVRQGGDFDFDKQPERSPSVLVSAQATLTRSPQLPQLRSRSVESYSTSNLRDAQPNLFALDSDGCIATFQ